MSILFRKMEPLRVINDWFNTFIPAFDMQHIIYRNKLKQENESNILVPMDSFQ